MNNSNSATMAGIAGAAWGIIGFAVVLLDAINRLAHMALSGLSVEMLGVEWLTLLAVIVFMAYVEGYRGFQRSFSPRTAARAYYLYRNPSLGSVLLAPAFCMGFFRATRKPLLFAWVGTSLIVSLVVALRFLPQPWRAMVDAGVVAGLSWGLLSFLWCVWTIFRADGAGISPEVPEE